MHRERPDRIDKPKGRGIGAQARERFGLDPNKPVFLFCGKLIEKKQPLGLLTAIEVARSRGADIELLVVGEGHLRAECEELVKERKLPVKFAGFLNQSEIGQAYSAADALVLPSDNGETWGLVVNEAFAARIPALVSNQVGCHLDLISKSTGWVHPFSDWEAFGAQLAEAGEDRGRLHTMGRAAHELIQQYSPQSAADGILAACRYCIQDST